MIGLPVNIEPVLFIYAAALGIYYTESTAFLYWKICMYSFQNSPSSEISINGTNDLNYYCQHLEERADMVNSTDKHNEHYVQTEAAKYSLYATLVFSLPAVFMSLFFGAWSDRYGRKPLLVASMAGSVFGFVPIIAAASFAGTAPSLFLAGAVIAGCTGGPLMIITQCFTMITDETRRKDEKYLNIRLGIGSGMLLLGILAGSLVSSLMLQNRLSWAFVFLVALGLNFSAVIYVAVLTKETLTIPDTEDAGSSDSQEVVDSDNRPCCDLSTVTDQYTTLVKLRPYKKRGLLLTSLVAYSLVYATDTGMPGLQLLFVKHAPLDWTNSQYGYLIAFITGLGGAGMIVLPLTVTLCKVPDIVLAIFSLLVMVIRGIMFGLADTTIKVYLASSLTVLNSSFYPAMRTFIAKLVDKDEIGKIFAAILCAENIGPLVAGVIFNNIYTATVDHFDGVVFIIAAVAQAFLAVVFIVLFIIDPRRRGHASDRDTIVDEDSETDNHATA